MAEDTDGGRKLRTKERKKYIDQEIDEDDIDGKRTYSVEDKLASDKFTADMVQELKGPEFTMEWMQKNGLTRPVVFYDKTGLGLRVPSENFKVSDVKQCVGSRRILDVMDVNTQKAMEMSMKDWVRYYENPERDRLLNVISLEFCHTRLENYVESPKLVRQIDWVDRAWPRHLKECQTESTNVIEKMKYPKVQKYCLMSVAGCYTDFHVDFGGTSVWYHILHGEKIFWLAPPSQKNIDRYVEWTLSAKQGDTFLGDLLEQCQRITLQAGYTFIIPSGWIHAVYTPKDSLVFGGNFLHSFNIENQLLVSRIEDKTYVPAKFRYPFYLEIMWYVVDRYINCLTGRSYLSSCEKDDVDDDDQGFIQVDEDSRPPSRNPDSRPPSRAMDDNIDTKVKSDSGEDTPKLSKSVTIELTRIDAALRRSQSEEENQPPHVRPRAPKKTISDPNSAWEGGGGPKKWVNVTATELKGLRHLVDYLSGLMSLSPNKRGVPKEMQDPEAALREIKQLLEDHKNDDQDLAITGEPVIGWPESAKKKQPQLKLGYKTFKTAKPVKGATSSSSIRRRRTRCKQCEACTRTECGECTFCKDMKKFGGPGRMKQTCISRQCMAPILPSSSVCMICNQEGRPNAEDPDDISTSLMECGICWEIVHPSCLQKKYENLDNDNAVNEDLPNSWECSKCCNEGKQGQLKPRVRPGSSKKTKTEDHRFSADSDGSQEDESLSPVSPADGKRAVSKETSVARNGEGSIIKTETGASKWPSPIKKITAVSDIKVKNEDGTSSTILSPISLPQSLPKDESAKKQSRQPSSHSASSHKEHKKQIKKEKTSAPSSPSTPQHDETPRHPRKRIPAAPSSVVDKTSTPPQADAAGKRPKRENRNIFTDLEDIKSASETASVSLAVCTRSDAGSHATVKSIASPFPPPLSPSASLHSCSNASQSAPDSLNMQKLTEATTEHPDELILSEISNPGTDFNVSCTNSKHLLDICTVECGTNQVASQRSPCLDEHIAIAISASPDCRSINNETSITEITSDSSSISFSPSLPSLQDMLSPSSGNPVPTETSSSLHPLRHLNKTSNEKASFTFKKPLPRIHCAKVISFKPSTPISLSGAYATKPITPSYVSSHATIADRDSAVISMSAFPPTSAMPTSCVPIDVSLAMTVTDMYHPVIYDHPYCNLSSFV